MIIEGKQARNGYGNNLFVVILYRKAFTHEEKSMYLTFAIMTE